MQVDLSGRVAMVLGAGGGLGSAVAASLAAAGADVAACGRSPENVESTVYRLRDSGASARPYVFDLREPETADAAVDAVERELGAISILVNITGGPPPTPAAGTNQELWEEHFRALVASVIHLTDRVLPEMRKRGWGRIVTSVSSGVIAPIPHLALSNSLRSALVGWSKTLAGEVARDGVTVNVVIPGRIATSRVASLDAARAQREKRSIDEVASESCSGIPVGRYGQPEEYANVVTFLSSPLASYVTGSAIRVDGGLIDAV